MLWQIYYNFLEMIKQCFIEMYQSAFIRAYQQLKLSLFNPYFIY
nr:MAG TPA_asm: hypothetical protein [Caudoviricetes sp.]